MPELPEVETIRLGLEKHLVGERIEEVEIRHKKIFEGDPQKIIGAKFKSIRRLGKVLILDLDNKLSLVIHVKMTGQLIYSKSYTPHKHTHVIFHLDKSAKLFYNDIRKFGWIRVVPTNQVSEMKFLKSLGPEPYVGQASSGQALTLERFKEILKDKNPPIKILIMDQTKIGGVGNIYANDALYLAGIHPAKPAGKLLSQEVIKLFSALEEVLKRGIKYGGSSENTYVNALGEKGSYQKYAKVYRKTGQPCSKCKSPIQMIRLGGRGTFFCANCQK